MNLSWWVNDLVQAGRTAELISQIFWVIFSITLHELAHGWAAIWQGDDTPRRLGRMTANPMVHMGGTSIIVFLVVGFAWGLMPVDPSRFRWGRRGLIVVSGAGPAMNFGLAFVTSLLLITWLAVGPPGSNAFANVAIFLFTGIWLNIFLGVFNLLPFPPLDGSSVLSSLSFRAYQLCHHPNAPLFGMVGLIVIFFVTPIGAIIQFSCVSVAILVVELPGAGLGSPSIFDVVFR